MYTWCWILKTCINFNFMLIEYIKYMTIHKSCLHNISTKNTFFQVGQNFISSKLNLHNFINFYSLTKFSDWVSKPVSGFDYDNYHKVSTLFVSIYSPKLFIFSTLSKERKKVN